MKRNKRLLLKTAKRIEEFPASYQQSTWGEPDEDAPCGTVACLAGEIVICSERTVKKGIEKLYAHLTPQRGTPHVEELANELAGFTKAEGEALFYSEMSIWPGDYYERYRLAETQAEQAKVAAELLRYVANGGEIVEDSDED